MNYAEAAFQGIQRVAGARLLPMTVGHALLLQRMKSPFCPGEWPAAGIGDCALFIEVCRRDWESASNLVNSWRCRPYLWWRWLRLSFGFESKRAKLFALVSESWTGPDVTLSNPGSSGEDDALRVIVNTLCAHLGRTYADALRTPLRRALWDVCEYWRQQGALRFQADWEKEAFAEARKAASHG